MEDEVPGTGAGADAHEWRLVGRQGARCYVESVLLNHVAAEAGIEHETVGWIGAHGVGVGPGGHHVPDRSGDAIAADRADAEEVSGIRRAE
jgi:hypothetical protein